MQSSYSWQKTKISTSYNTFHIFYKRFDKKINHKLDNDKYKTQVSAKDCVTHPKKELTSTPLVLSSSGTDSVASVSGMSAEAFVVVKKA